MEKEIEFKKLYFRSFRQIEDFYNKMKIGMIVKWENNVGSKVGIYMGGNIQFAVLEIAKDKSVKEGKIQITCVAESLSEAINTIAPLVWNSDTNKSEYIKYKESDVIEVKLVETGVTIQNYISDYKEEEE